MIDFVCEYMRSSRVGEGSVSRLTHQTSFHPSQSLDLCKTPNAILDDMQYTYVSKVSQNLNNLNLNMFYS